MFTLRRFNKSECLNDYSPDREAIYCREWLAFEGEKGVGYAYNEKTKDFQLFPSFQKAREFVGKQLKD